MDSRDLAFPWTGNIQGVNIRNPHSIPYLFLIYLMGRLTNRNGFRRFLDNLTVKAVPPVSGPQVKTSVPSDSSYFSRSLLDT